MVSWGPQGPKISSVSSDNDVEVLYLKKKKKKTVGRGKELEDKFSLIGYVGKGHGN